MARPYASPGVGYSEIELPSTRNAVYSPVITIIGTAPKGPLGMTVVKNQRFLTDTFGVPSGDYPALCSAHYVANERCLIQFIRVAGSGKAIGTAGSDEDKFSFETREYDSTLQCYNVQVQYHTDSQTVDYMLLNGAEPVEEYRGLSYVKGGKRYLPNFLDTMGSPVRAVDHDEENLKDPKDKLFAIHGCDDGHGSIKTSDYINVIKDIKNPEVVDIGTLIVPGVSEPPVIDAFAELVRERGDCEYLPDVPFGMNANETQNFVDNVDSLFENDPFNNPWVSVFAPWVQIRFRQNRENIWLPPSAIAARITAKSDNIMGGCWFAAAGFSQDRGVIPDVVQVEYRLDSDARDKWQGDGGIINPIFTLNGKGTVIFGNRTSLRSEPYEQESVFCERSIRRMANYVRRIIIEKSWDQLFNPNDSLTWDAWKASIDPKLKTIKDTRGIRDYKIVMDETTVSEDDVRNGMAPGIVYVRPMHALEYIAITFAVTEDSVIFQNESVLEETEEV